MVMSMSIQVKELEHNQEQIQPAIVDSPRAVQQVKKIEKDVGETLSETNLSAKMADLNTMLENLSDEVDSLRVWHKTDYLEALEVLKSQVQEIRDEWHNFHQGIQTQRDKFESVLQSFPGVIETATLKALSLRVVHLEQLVSEIFHETHARSTARGSRKQLMISIAALGVTVVIWVVFLTMNLLS